MARLACKLTYDGTDFAGYQVQPNQRTVQAELEAALRIIHKGVHIPVVASGRTDARVHAAGQVIHFDTSLEIPAEKWPQVLNTRLPEDIGVEEVEEVSEDFHARFHTVSKEYRFYVTTGTKPNVFRRNQAVHIREELDVPAMQTAALALLGTHDFSTFCAANTSVQDKTRTITQIVVQPRGKEIEFAVCGSGFLYNMVRIIVGTLLEVGTGKRKASEMATILASCDRLKAGKTAPPHGLYLWRVSYEPALFAGRKLSETPG
ncbi:tRNA pseudouridine(38-40) synthase TruA [Shouchella shacheensis]|uniref:tRNA pseudouridine(38-40) synthase TruA n=1 Tax=Shouchella shacheensis TaxID=1649580 RepID=UPI0007404114|nr:tRNA pseudouridine(38-40) synthase TruA [Shouchella shacheensis]